MNREFQLAVAVLCILLGLAACRGQRSAPIEPADARDEWNVVLIIIDTLRPDHMGAYGYTRHETTPVFDDLATRSLLFENAYSPASWTRPALLSILASQHPFEHQALSERAADRLADDAYLLPEFLAAGGHQTAIFFTNPHYYFGAMQGFEHVDYAWNESSRWVTQRISRWLQELDDEPFFLLVHYMDPHDRYLHHPEFAFAPASFELRRIGDLYDGVGKEGGVGRSCSNRTNARPLPQEDLEHLQAAYDGEIAFTDRMIGNLLQSLQLKGRMDRTIVIITSDHGEEFLDHGGYWHGCTLYEEQIRAPLLIHVPGESAQRLQPRVSLIDIYPTIVDLLGREPPDSPPLSGRSLVPLIQGQHWPERSVVSGTAFRGPPRYSIVSGRHKLVLNSENGQAELYDLDEDPRERRDLLAAGAERTTVREIVTRLKTELEGLGYGPPRKQTPGSSTDELDPELIKQLKSLGYLAD